MFAAKWNPIFWGINFSVMLDTDLSVLDSETCTGDTFDNIDLERVAGYYSNIEDAVIAAKADAEKRMMAYVAEMIRNKHKDYVYSGAWSLEEGTHWYLRLHNGSHRRDDIVVACIALDELEVKVQ